MISPLRVYIDTSVFGGYFDKEFETSSQCLFRFVQNGKIIPLISDTVMEEIIDAPQRVKDLVSDTIVIGAERLDITDEAIQLQEKYLQAAIVTDKYADDALHVAQATLAHADVIATWNFKHLVNPIRIRLFNHVNIKSGYDTIVIMTPNEINPILEKNHG